MSVYKDKKTGKWFCVYRVRDIKGKQKQIRKSGFETRELAYKYECSQIVNNSIVKNKVRFKDLYTEYIKHCKGIKSDSTITGYNYIYNKHFKILDDFYVSDITTDTITMLRTNILSKRECCISYINKLFSIFKMILDYGVKVRYIDKNPIWLIDPLKDYSVNDTKVDFYTIDEFKQFISVVPADSVFYLAFNILYYTGLRSGELLALNIRDINLDKGTINVNKTISRSSNGKIDIKTTKTSASISNVYIPSTLKLILSRYLSNYYFDPNYPLLVYNKHRLSKRTLENYKNKYCDESGLRRIRLHDFRHSFASLIYELSNYNYNEVAKRLRHANVSTVMRTYIHVFPNRRNELDNKLDTI